MYSSSLLSYSISVPPKRDTTIPISNKIVLPPIHNITSNSQTRPKVLHPPVDTLMYRSVMHNSPTITPQTKLNTYPVSPLTEQNLLYKDTFKNANPNYYSGIPSPPKSSSSVGSMSPVASPSFNKASLAVNSKKQSHPSAVFPASSEVAQVQVGATSAGTGTTANSQTSQQSGILGKKRRQRSGPSCDSCRQRKVKCNAEISILSTNPSTFQEQYKQFMLSSDEESNLLNGKSVTIEQGLQLIIQNQKLVKFRSCKSCELKQLNCCFSKGFTKEDIVVLGKKTSESNKVSKPATSATTAKLDKIVKHPAKKSLKYDPSNNRKSSCNLCRQRKVKCLFSEALGKCESCHRKNKSCSLDC